MASLECDKASGRYRVRFRYGGRPFKRSLKTTDRREADAVRVRVEETVRLLERGRLQMPADADPGSFILSDGKLNGKPVRTEVLTLDGLFRLYQEKLPEGAKELSTLEGERIHLKHLLRHLRPRASAERISVGDMQSYIEKRLQDSWRGRRVRPNTVKKEVTTFRLIWNWAVDQGYLNGPAPVKGLKYPKTDEKPPFMT